MSGAGIFIVGAVVTALVATAMGLLIWGAIMDGRRRAVEFSGTATANTGGDGRA